MKLCFKMEKEVEQFVDFKFKDKGNFYPITKESFLIELPSEKKVRINKYNLSSYARKFYIPFCSFASIMEGINYKKVTKDSNICFFDVETENDESFKYALVKDKKTGEIKKFTKAKELLEELKKYDFVCGHNTARFDYEVLYKECPEYFRINQLSSFIEYIPLYFLSLDTYQMARMNASLGEEGYSLYSLAKLCGYKKERIDVKDKKRCSQDIEMLELVYEKLNVEEGYNFLTEYSHCDNPTIMNSYSVRFVKQVLLNRYLVNGYVPTSAPQNNYKEPLKALHYAKEGIYYNQVYMDIKSTYPIATINLGKSLYKEEKEPVFVTTMKELVEYAKNPKIKGYAKFLANVMIGSMRDLKNNFKNEELWSEILNFAHKEVLKIFDSIKERCVYSNTDCFIVNEEEIIKHEFYELKEKYKFEWIVIYDCNKILGKTIDGRIIKRHFNKYFKCDLIRKADEIIEKLLLECPKDKIVDLLNNSIKLTEQAKSFLENPKFDKDLLKIVIRKKSSVCEGINAEYGFIWEKLDYGFNEVYSTNEGFSKKPKDLDINKYYYEIDENAKQYKFNVNKYGEKD